MKKAHVVTGFVTVLVALGSQACTLGSDTYITSEPGTQASSKDAGAGKDGDAPSQKTTSGQAPSAGCTGGSYATPDLSKLTACGGGKGHCFDKSKTQHAEMFGACPDASEVCVPDEVLSAAGKPLPSCTSILGAGGCITMSLIPAMEADPRAKAALKQDVCAAGQVCAPCFNPENNNAPTGLCEPIGVFGECSGSAAPAPAPSGGTTTAPALPSCCTKKGNSNGVCLQSSAIPESRRDQAPQDSCADGLLCVPKSMVAGKPVTCAAGFMGKGVCMDTCFNEMMGLASMIGLLSSEGCGSTEVCVPCSFAGSDVPGCGG